MLSNRDEIHLVLLAQTGDRDSFDELLRRIYIPLSRYVASLVGSTAADDVVQDTVIQVYRKLKWLREPTYFRSWVYRIASRLAFAQLKGIKRWESLEDNAGLVDSLVASEELGIRMEWDSSLAILLEEVSPSSRAVLHLHFQQDLSLEEVAAVLEIPIGTVKSRLSYGLSILRKRFTRKGKNE